MMDIRRAAALLLALVMIAALTVGCGKKQSDTPADTPGCRCGRPDSRPAAGEAGVLQRIGDAAVRAGGGYMVLGATTGISRWSSPL